MYSILPCFVLVVVILVVGGGGGGGVSCGTLERCQPHFLRVKITTHDNGNGHLPFVQSPISIQAKNIHSKFKYT